MQKTKIQKTWYFFLILAIAQTANVLMHLFAPKLYPQVVYLSYNFVLIICTFFLSYRVYQMSESILSAVSAAILLLTISDVLVNVIATSIAVKIAYSMPFLAVLQQSPAAFKNGLMFLPMVVLLAFIACRIAHKRLAIK